MEKQTTLPSLDDPSCSVPCFECGKPSDHNHHVIPRVYGGTKTIPLCERCHGMVHDRKFTDHRAMTIKGLERAKARGVKLGANGHKLAEVNKEAADSFAADLKPLVSQYIAAGLSRRIIADCLNRQNIPTARGGKWHVTSVQRLATRLGIACLKPRVLPRT
jgi:hypothetical protein